MNLLAFDNLAGYLWTIKRALLVQFFVLSSNFSRLIRLWQNLNMTLGSIHKPDITNHFTIDNSSIHLHVNKRAHEEH